MGYVLLGILAALAWAVFGGMVIWAASQRKDIALGGIAILAVLTIALAVQLIRGGSLPS
jgi:hypothetical protein